MPDAGRPAESLAEHTAIVAAIAHHDAVEAERTMRANLSGVARALRERGAREPATDDATA